MADSSKNQKHNSRDRKRKAPMASTESPELPEPECLKQLIDSNHCSEPFEKQITSSDKSQNRLSLDKGFVKRHCLPLLRTQEDEKEGIPVTVYGPDGKGYQMSFVFWGSTDMYVLNKGWKKFSDEHDLKALEHWATIWMFRHKNTGDLCFAITWKYVPKKEEEEIFRPKTCRMNASRF